MTVTTTSTMVATSSRADSRNATSTAAMDSMAESKPKPITETSPASSPAVTATTPSTAPHAITQRWARTILAAFPQLDGLHYNSRFAGHPCAALFPNATNAIPDRPVITVPLTHPGLAFRLAGAARRLGYLVI